MYKETNLPVYSTWSHHTHSHYRRSVCTNKLTSYILHVTDSLNCWHSGLSTIYPVFVVRYIHISVGCIVCTGKQLCSGHNHAAKWNVSQRVLTRAVHMEGDDRANSCTVSVKKSSFSDLLLICTNAAASIKHTKGTIYLLRRKQFVAHTQFIYYTESSWKNYCTHTLPVT